MAGLRLVLPSWWVEKQWRVPQNHGKNIQKTLDKIEDPDEGQKGF